MLIAKLRMGRRVVESCWRITELSGRPLSFSPVQEAAAEAVKIRERSLIAAAESLGVRTQRGQWWLPG
jgi:hypothetical protein